MSSCSSCGSSCAIGEKPAAVMDAPEELSQAAEALGVLLADAPEFQALARWSRAVRLDAQVSRLVSVLQERAYYSNEANPDQTAALEEELEALPVVREFRAAETRARGLFSAVDAAITQAAGLPFAQLAKPSGHG